MDPQSIVLLFSLSQESFGAAEDDNYSAFSEVSISLMKVFILPIRVGKFGHVAK